MLHLRPNLILRNAKSATDPYISKLLPVVGDLSSARNELRWLREECQKRVSATEQRSLLEEYVTRRSSGEPLQYILGSAYFGGLEIKCRPGVFIPRPETAAAVSYLVRSLISRKTKLAENQWVHRAGAKSLKTEKKRKFDRTDTTTKADRTETTIKVLDLCSGSGCIPLLFWHQFYKSAPKANFALPHLDIVGVDISPKALELARENHAILLAQQSHENDSNIEALRSLQQMQFVKANVMRQQSVTKKALGLTTLRQALGEHAKTRIGKESIRNDVTDNDIWISNPPYISAANYINTTSKSVRDFEPKSALVPPGGDGDRFYRDILRQAMKLRPKVVLFEVEDMEQAIRVVKLAIAQSHWHTFEIWRDHPSAKVPLETDATHDQTIKVIGEGEARSVLLCTRDGADLIGRYPLSGLEVECVKKESAIVKLQGKIQSMQKSLEVLQQRANDQAGVSGERANKSLSKANVDKDSQVFVSRPKEVPIINAAPHQNRGPDGRRVDRSGVAWKSISAGTASELATNEIDNGPGKDHKRLKLKNHAIKRMSTPISEVSDQDRQPSVQDATTSSIP